MRKKDSNLCNLSPLLILLAFFAFLIQGQSVADSADVIGPNEANSFEVAAPPLNEIGFSNFLTDQKVLRNRLSSPASSVRSKAAIDLYRHKRQMTVQELDMSWDALLDTAKRSPCQNDWLELTWVLNAFSHTMMEKGLMSHQDIDTDLVFLAEYASDPDQTALNRRIAIQTIGMARVSSAGPAVAALLDDPNNWQVEEIARSAPVALAALNYPGAVSKISRIIDSTESHDIGDTAAYAMGEIGHLDAVPHLVAYRERTGSNLSPDTALRKMRPQIIEAIMDPYLHLDQRIACIRATVAFFSEDHESNQDFLIPLAEIISNTAVEPAVRIAAVERLLEHVKMVDFQTGNTVLKPLITTFEKITGIGKTMTEIEARLNARPLELIATDEYEEPIQ